MRTSSKVQLLHGVQGTEIAQRRNRGVIISVGGFREGLQEDVMTKSSFEEYIFLGSQRGEEHVW